MLYGGLNMETIISVITPAYNAAETLPRLFESLMAQTFRQFEWIVINDGSVDDTLEVLNDLARESRFPCRIIDQLNKGVSWSRNNGLEVASGKFVLFVDADDYLEPGMLQCLYQGILPDRDFCFCNHIRQREDGDIISTWNYPYRSYEFKNIEELFSRICSGRIRILFSTGLYKKSIIDAYALRFNTTLSHTEDDLFMFQYLCYCKSAVHLNTNLYHYVIGDSNAIHIITQDRIKGTAKALEILIETMKNANLPGRYARAFENGIFREKLSLLFRMYFNRYRSLDFLDLPEIKVLEKRITRNTFVGLKGLKELLRLKGLYLLYNKILSL